MNLDNPKLVITHSAEDEGDIYFQRIEEYAKKLGVELISIEDLVGPEEGYDGDNHTKYSIGDVYHCADLVCYPSGYEGFGNAFLETIYYKKPIVVNRYSIYIADIEPKGFDNITIEGFVTNRVIDQITDILTDNERLKRMVDLNYELGNRYFSYEVLENLLLHLINMAEMKFGS